MQSLDRLAITSAPSLGVIYSPSADYAIAAGNTFELGITVSNQGDRGAVIKVYLDETSQPLWQWCQQSSQYIALESQQSGELLLQIPIPLDTPPGVYTYLVVVDASQHYPDENPQLHQAQLTVLPTIQSAIAIDDPTFNLLPKSTSNQPIAFQPGDKLELEATIFNRSQRVDRYRLVVIDLPRSWWQVTYPQESELGLATEADSLALNPQSTTTVKIQIQPPLGAKSAGYSSTIQLKSINSPNLTLLDIVHFQLTPVHNLDWELQTIIAKISQDKGKFAILIHNRGNTYRDVKLRVKETRERPICEYILATDSVKLLPKSDRSVELEIQPKKWWRRPWWGRGLPLEFQLECQDAHQLPLARQKLKSKVVWEARPWWHLALLLLVATGSISGIILALWWLLFKPPASPKVLKFGAESSVYQAVNGDFINLSWQLEHPQQIDSLTLVGRSPDGKVVSQSRSFDLSQGLPESLAKHCTSQEVLYCRNVQTDARQPGDYVFELIVAAEGAKIPETKATTNTITIQPAPAPQILQFTAAADSSGRQTINFDFTLSNYEQLQAVQIQGLAPDGTVNYSPKQYSLDREKIATLESYCQQQERLLTCQGVPLTITQPGQYIFELAAIGQTPTNKTAIVERQRSSTIAIAAPEQPQLANLSSSQPTYQAGSNSVRLNWDILQPQELAAIRLIGRSPKGIVNSPAISYDFSQGIPPELVEYCYETADIISCRHVPTSAREAGDYIFELMSIANGNPNLVDSSILSDVIRIEAISLPAPPPAPLEILSLQINGVSAPPKYIAKIDPQNPDSELIISWKILSDPSAKVELLPTPGKVNTEGILTYPLSTRATTERLTLRVTNPDGRQIERSLIVETTISDDHESPSSEKLPQSDRSLDILVPKDFKPKLD